MGQPVGGTVFLSVDGTTYKLGESVSYSTATTVKESKVGLSGPAGYTEKPRTPHVECEVYTMPDLDLKDFEAITDATLTLELKNGRLWVYSGVRYVGETDWDAAEGTGTVRFEADDCRPG